MAFKSRRSGDVSSILGSSKITRVGQFLRLNPPTFIGTKVDEDPQAFIDKIKKIFRVMHTSDNEG